MPSDGWPRVNLGARGIPNVLGRGTRRRNHVHAINYPTRAPSSVTARHVNPVHVIRATVHGGQPPVVSDASSRTTHPVPSVSSSQPSGSATPLARAALPTPRGAQLGDRERRVRVEPGEQVVELGERVDQRQVAAQLAAGGEALEVPRRRACGTPCSPAPPPCAGEQLGVPAHHRGDLAEARAAVAATGSSPREGRRQVAEQPRPAEAAAADDDARGAGLLDHPERVGGLPDVAVAEHRDVDVLDEAGDRVPVGGAGVALDRRTPVQRDRRAPRTPGRSGRRRGRSGGPRRCPCGSSSSPARRSARRPRPPPRGSRRAGVRFHGSAAPPPLRVTFGTGQPKFRSTCATPYSAQRISVALPTYAGSVP